MIYAKSRKNLRLPGGFFHLEEEKSKTRVFGYGHGEHIKLKDEYGNIWRGRRLATQITPLNTGFAMAGESR